MWLWVSRWYKLLQYAVYQTYDRYGPNIHWPDCQNWLQILLSVHVAFNHLFSGRCHWLYHKVWKRCSIKIECTGIILATVCVGGVTKSITALTFLVVRVSLLYSAYPASHTTYMVVKKLSIIICYVIVVFASVSVLFRAQHEDVDFCYPLFRSFIHLESAVLTHHIVGTKWGIWLGYTLGVKKFWG